MGVKPDNHNHNNHNNNNNNSNRPSSYNIVRRREALKEIRRLLIEERLSYKEIQDRLNLPSTTFFRYLDVLFESDRDILLRYVDDKEILNQVAILQEKFIHRAKQLEDLIKDPKVRAADKISAHNLGAELDTSVMKLAMETPYQIINRRQRLKHNQDGLSLSMSSSSSSSSSSSIPTLTLPPLSSSPSSSPSSSNNKKEEEEYDELDYYTDDEEEEEEPQHQHQQQQPQQQQQPSSSSSSSNNTSRTSPSSPSSSSKISSSRILSPRELKEQEQRWR